MSYSLFFTCFFNNLFTVLTELYNKGAHIHRVQNCSILLNQEIQQISSEHRCILGSLGTKHMIFKQITLVFMLFKFTVLAQNNSSN